MQQVYRDSKTDYINLVNNNNDQSPILDVNEIKINDIDVLNEYFNENEKSIYVKKVNDVYDENVQEIGTNLAYYDYAEQLKLVIDDKKSHESKSSEKKILNGKFECMKQEQEQEKCVCDIDNSEHDTLDESDDQYIGTDILDIKTISEVYDKIIKTQEYLKKRYNLDNNQLLELMFVRVKDGKLYVISSIYSKKLHQQYVPSSGQRPEWFNLAINAFIKIRQSHAWDQIYTSAPDIYVKMLLQMNQENCSFMTLYHLEYYLKRHLQKVLTDFTLNFRVKYNEMKNKFVVVRGNEQYAEFILHNVKQIDNFVNQHINDPLIIQKLPLHDQIKNILKNNPLHVNFIAKGGNLINMLLNSKCKKQNNTYSLNDYLDYFKNISDWDFDIKINIHNPLEKTDIIDVNNICSPEYNNIHQQVKKIVIEMIKQYFTNIGSMNSNESMTNIQNMIQCQIKYANHLINSYRGNSDIIFEIVKSHIDVKFNESSNKLDNVDMMLCDLDNENAQSVIAKSRSVTETSDTIFSYISQQLIGESREYFDLTRLSVRIGTSCCLLRTKIECIYFGIDVFNSLNYNVVNFSTDAYPEYVWKIGNREFQFIGKNAPYLVNELIKIVFESTEKQNKRLFRFFKLFDTCLVRYDNVFDLMNVNFKYMENKLINYRYNVNIVDTCIILFLQFRNIISVNISTYDQIPVFIVLKRLFNDYVGKITQTQNPDEKIVFKYPNEHGFPFLSYMTMGMHRTLRHDKYFPDYVYAPY